MNESSEGEIRFVPTPSELKAEAEPAKEPDTKTETAHAAILSEEEIVAAMRRSYRAAGEVPPEYYN